MYHLLILVAKQVCITVEQSIYDVGKRVNIRKNKAKLQIVSNQVWIYRIVTSVLKKTNVNV